MVQLGHPVGLGGCGGLVGGVNKFPLQSLQSHPVCLQPANRTHSGHFGTNVVSCSGVHWASGALHSSITSGHMSLHGGHHSGLGG